MIAGKTNDEISGMKYWVRSLWYKAISLEEKGKAMQMMENIRRSKISAWWTPERRDERSGIMIGENSSNFGKMRSEETRAKQRTAWTPERRAEFSKSKMGESNPMYGRTGEKHPMYGKTFTHTKESKAKMKESWTSERRTKQSIIMMDRIVSEETRDKLSKFNTGKILSKETRAKISAAEMGEKNHNWRGGKSFEPYGVEFNNELKEQVRKRDNYTCQECDKTQKELGCKLDIHHIDYDKENNNPENLISLCRSCHVQTNFGREEWMKYFREMVYLKDNELRR